MNKKTYLNFITVVFIVLIVNTLLGFLFHKPILSYKNITYLKLILIIIISGYEAYSTKNDYFRIIGLMAVPALYIGLHFKIILYPWANEMIIVSGILLTIGTALISIKDKNKSYINYLLLFFVAQRLLVILYGLNNYIWWLDLITCTAITVLRIKSFYKTRLA